jgi:hypothetical protein
MGFLHAAGAFEGHVGIQQGEDALELIQRFYKINTYDDVTKYFPRHCKVLGLIYLAYDVTRWRRTVRHTLLRNFVLYCCWFSELCLLASG